MDAVEDIKQKLAIDDVISEYVQLKRAGRNYKGLSPFSAEKTPSFMVSPEKQIWHDFSSGKGGDMFSFVMEMEGLDFKGALEHLARKAGIDLAQYQTGRSADLSKVKERLYQAHELATKFYQAQFKQNKTALDYIFKQRAFTKEVVLDFQIGYSPNNGTALLDFLTKKGFTGDELQKAGLVTKRYRGLGDMFRGRIQIPLADAQGRVIGFTARALDPEDTGPKYLNTPQTLLYDKGRHVYGLHLAKEAIRKQKYAVLVEGNLDVIACHQAGTKHVVATAGTALTEMHLKALNRFTGDLRLAFDQDKAGLAATERAIPIANRVGVTLSIITVPDGKDPDELIKKNRQAWYGALNSPQYALDWLIERYAGQLDMTSATGKREFSDITLRVVRQLTDKVEQDHYLQAIAQRSGINREALEQKLKGVELADKPRLRRSKVTYSIDKERVEQLRWQNQLMSLALMQPPLRHYLKPITYDMLFDEQSHQLLRFLQDNPQFSGDPKEAEVLRDIADYVKILSLQFEELYHGLELLELRNEAARLQIRLIEHYVKTKKQPLIEELRQTTDDAEATKLLEQAKELDNLLKRL